MKEFTLTVKDTPNGTLFTSTNKGFTALELIGILSLKLHDIQRQRAGEIKPKIKFDRTVITKTRKTGRKRRTRKSNSPLRQ